MKNKSKNKSGLFRTLAKITSSSETVAPPNLKAGLSSAASTSEGVAIVQDLMNNADDLLRE